MSARAPRARGGPPPVSGSTKTHHADDPVPLRKMKGDSTPCKSPLHTASVARDPWRVARLRRGSAHCSRYSR